MKRAATDLPKFKKLKAKLKLKHYEAVGLLESIWMLTAKVAPDGRIGVLNNEDIAISIEWSGDPDKLIEQLVACRWLDRGADKVLTVHDWDQHRKCAKSSLVTIEERQTFADSMTFQSGPPEEFKRFWEAYPRKVAPKDAEKEWHRAVMDIILKENVNDVIAQGKILQAAIEFAESPSGSEPVGSDDYRPAPAKWLSQGRYMDDRVHWQKDNGDQPKRSRKAIRKSDAELADTLIDLFDSKTVAHG